MTSLGHGDWDMGSSLWLVESTLELPDLPGRTQFSLNDSNQPKMFTFLWHGYSLPDPAGHHVS